MADGRVVEEVNGSIEEVNGAEIDEIVDGSVGGGIDRRVNEGLGDRFEMCGWKR